jgi:hypothetical protein
MFSSQLALYNKVELKGFMQQVQDLNGGSKVNHLSLTFGPERLVKAVWPSQLKVWFICSFPNTAF